MEKYPVRIKPVWPAFAGAINKKFILKQKFGRGRFSDHEIGLSESTVKATIK